MTKSGAKTEIGGIEFDPARGLLRHPGGAERELRPQSAAVLSILVEHVGEVVPKSELMSRVWPDTFVTDDSIVQCISEIRKGLGPEGGTVLRTVPKVGYVLRADPGPRRESKRQALRRAAAAAAVIAAALLPLFIVLQSWMPASGDRPVLAVLRLDNLGGADDAYFAEGLSEDLLTDLSQIPSIDVLSRTASFALRGEGPGAQAAARERGATHLVEGSVRRDGGSLRINVQLVATADGRSLWADRYDRDFGDLFALQDEVREKIVSALAVELAPHETDRIVERRPSEMRAYDLLLRGRHAESEITRDGIRRAAAFYEAALDVDPGYGAAHARLATMYDFLARFGWGDTPGEDRRRALGHARQAVALDPGNPYSHWVYGRILARRVDQGLETRREAIAALETALRLDPDFADAHAFLALLRLADGRAEDAAAAIELAFSHAPEAPYWYYQNRAIISYMAGRYAAAVADLEVAAIQSPSAPYTRTWLAAAYARSGDVAAAEWEIEEALLLGSADTADGVLRANSIFHRPEQLDAYREGLMLAGMPR